jgi:gliding motility-associated-like protein
MKQVLITFLLGFCFSISTNVGTAQPLNCAGVDANKIFLLEGDSIYRLDPALPLSATNPIAFIPFNNGSNGLAICNNLNGGSPSPTFYTVNVNNEYEYWNGTTWINTSQTAGNFAAVNIGGGVSNIYNYVGGSNSVYKYTGAGNGTLLTNVQGAGPYDLATDLNDNFYFFNANVVPGFIYKYSPAGLLLDSVTVTGFPPSSFGGGFAYVGNIVMASFGGSDVWLGTLSGTTVALNNVGNVNFTISDVANCPSGALISTDPQAVIISADTICGNLCFTPTDGSSGNIVTYQWSFAGGTPSAFTGANPGQVCFAGNGKYAIQLIVTDTAGKKDTTSKFIYLSNAQTQIITPSIVTCRSASPYPLNAIGSVNYNWLPSTGLSCTNCSNPIASPIATTQYIVIGTDSINCKTADTVTITVLPIKPNWFIPEDSLCINEPLIGSSTSTGSSLTQTWSFGDGSSAVNGSTITPPHFYNTGGNYILKLLLADALGCKDTLTQNIYVANLPIANFAANPEIATLDYPNIYYVNSSTDAISYQWYYQNQLFSTDLNTVKTFFDTGTYCITLVACNALNCCDTIVKCSQVLDQAIAVPNAFTPDGNDNNDKFLIVEKNVEVSFIKVFDRWGNNVFTTTNKTEGWDGTYKNQKCDVGTYFYVIKYKKLGKNKLLKGEVMLLR